MKLVEDMCLMLLGFVLAWIAAALIFYASIQIAPYIHFFRSPLNAVSAGFVVLPFVLTGVPFGLWAYWNAETRLTAYLFGAVKTMLWLAGIFLVLTFFITPKTYFSADVVQVLRIIATFFAYGLTPAIIGAAIYWAIAGRNFGPQPDIRRPIRSDLSAGAATRSGVDEAALR